MGSMLKVSIIVHLRVELGHFSDGEITADVRVEDKEGSWVPSQDLVSEMVDSSCSTQWGILLQIPARSSFIPQIDTVVCAYKHGQEILRNEGKSTQ